MAEDRLFVAREEDAAALQHLWNEAASGKPKVVRLQSPFGGGRRAVVGEFLRQASASNDDLLVWRVSCLDNENGLQWLVRMYGSLVATITADPVRKGRIELALNTALPSQPKRVQGWFQEFVGSLKEAKTDREKGAVQLRIPKDNPLIGLVEVIMAISKKFPIILDLQAPFSCYSLALAQFVEAVLSEGRQYDAKLMVILHDEPATDSTRSVYPMPLLDLYERRADDIAVQTIAPWGVSETQRFLDSKNLTSDAARIAEIAKGRPGFIAELAEILEERGLLASDLADVTLAKLVPFPQGEVSPPVEDAEEGKRKQATASDIAQIAYFAALLGHSFPSNLVADMGGFERDSVDDMIDAFSDLFEEVQFAEEMGSWIYKFKRGSYREGVLEQNDNDAGHDLARRVGMFMEQFLAPRAYVFIPRTAKVYGEHGAEGRANLMRSLALSNDAQDMWGLSYDLCKYFDAVAWPDPMRRTVYMNLLERLVSNGNIQAAEQVLLDATEWATSKSDRELTAWLLFAGSRLDTRRQDPYRARDRARDSIKMYEALENPVRQAEIYNHLAAIELQDGNPNAALELVEKALELGRIENQDGKKSLVPAILANAEFIRGSIARRANKLVEAAEHFRVANDVAGRSGLAALALDAGLSFGESLLASGQTEKARDILDRVTQIAIQLRNPVRERNARELLAQAEGSLRNFPNALQHQTRVWELTQSLKFEQAMPLDLYNLGFFNLANQKPAEALTFFRQAEERFNKLGEHPVIKELHYHMGIAHLQTGNLDAAKTSLRSGLRPAQKAKDWRRMVSALDTLAAIENRQGNKPVAKKLLTDAISFAEKGGLKEERRTLRKKLDALA